MLTSNKRTTQTQTLTTKYGKKTDEYEKSKSQEGDESNIQFNSSL